MVSKVDVFSVINWFEKWPWLHYNELNNLAYCFTCTKVIKEKKVKIGNMDAWKSTLIGRCHMYV